MYINYFGLKEAPFSIAPNPDYLYMTERHQEALAHLYHSMESDSGFVLLTGDVGTGKTTVCRCFLDNLPENAQVAFILNPFLSGRELLREICQELKIDHVPEKATLRESTDAIYRHLLSNHSQGKQTLLLIDEAQHLHFKVMELIRLLTNLETDSQKLLKIVLVGQPELNTTLDKPELTQVSQRITARYHIKPLSIEETQAYIDYRLRMAGFISEKKLFPKSIAKKIFSVTQGIPRLINVICDRALLGTYAKSRAVVDMEILNKAIQEVRGKQSLTSKFNWYWLSGAVALVVLLIVGFFYFTQLTQSQTIETPSAENNSPPAEPVKEIVLLDDDSSNKVLESMQQAESETNADNPVSTNIDQPVNSAFLDQSQKDISEITYFSLENTAVNSLLNSFQTQQFVDDQNCDSVVNIGWQCRKLINSNWNEILDINRPAILILKNDNGENYYLNIIEIEGDQAHVIHKKGRSILAIDEIQQQWSGDFIYLWQPPSGFSDYIYFNSNEYLVNWLANAFSIIDKRKELLSKGQFNSLLKQRVILFQKQNNMEEDGIAGIKTVLRINEQLGVAKTLNAKI
jgi:general secretion pathway protein A